MLAPEAQLPPDAGHEGHADGGRGGEEAGERGGPLRGPQGQAGHNQRYKTRTFLFGMIANQDFLGWQLIYDRKWGAAKDLMEKTLPEATH